ncbi:MAG TPA: hypothetical protein VLJ60_06195, partial [bacterium]|nr:hypothetical protein [bacterium]
MTYLPLSYLLGSRAKVDILRILVNKQNYTGRKIATLSSTNPNSNKKALDFLIETGIVDREHIGNAFHYRLNESHLLYEPMVNLFKEEEKTVNRIMKTGASFIEEYAPKTLAGFVSYLRNDVVLTVLAHSFPCDEMKEYIFEKTGFRVIIKMIDTLNLNENDLENFVDRV